ncbi:MAG TPA: cytochrome c3 family protein [Candidatus Aquicultor sp.]
MFRKRRIMFLSFVLLNILAISITLLVNEGQLLAFDNPHFKPRDRDTDTCAQCHRSHTAVDKDLSTPFVQSEQCLVCHDGTGSSYNIAAVLTKTNRHSRGGQDGGSSKQCASCHEVHTADPNLWRLLIDPRNTRNQWYIVGAANSNYDSTTTSSGMYRWCESCHTDSTSMAWLGATILRAAKTSTYYIPYDIRVSSWTSYEQVDNNGDTSTAAYWQFFNADTIITTMTIDSTETTVTRFGYNDPLAVGNSAHGRASSSESSTAGMLEWKGPYRASYPAVPCTECHDHHASNQPWMIADTITVGSTETAGFDMRLPGGQKQFCEACHVGTYVKCDTAQKCTNCHRHGKQF